MWQSSVTFWSRIFPLFDSCFWCAYKQPYKDLPGCINLFLNKIRKYIIHDTFDARDLKSTPNWLKQKCECGGRGRITTFHEWKLRQLRRVPVGISTGCCMETNLTINYIYVCVCIYIYYKCTYIIYIIKHIYKIYIIKENIYIIYYKRKHIYVCIYMYVYIYMHTYIYM